MAAVDVVLSMIGVMPSLSPLDAACLYATVCILIIITFAAITDLVYLVARSLFGNW